jgi:hypothetical protein
MKFISTRIITTDVNRLVDFYEMVTEVSATWGNELFAEIPTSVGTLAIGSDKTVPLFGDGSADAVGKPRDVVPGSGWKPGQPVYSGHGGGSGQVRSLTVGDKSCTATWSSSGTEQQRVRFTASKRGYCQRLTP